MGKLDRKWSSPVKHRFVDFWIEFRYPQYFRILMKQTLVTYDVNRSTACYLDFDVTSNKCLQNSHHLINTDLDRWHEHITSQFYNDLNFSRIQNLILTTQSTQIESVISVAIKDCIHHYPMALFNHIPGVVAYFYNIPGSRRQFTTYPDRGAV